MSSCLIETSARSPQNCKYCDPEPAAILWPLEWFRALVPMRRHEYLVPKSGCTKYVYFDSVMTHQECAIVNTSTHSMKGALVGTRPWPLDCGDLGASCKAEWRLPNEERWWPFQSIPSLSKHDIGPHHRPEISSHLIHTLTSIFNQPTKHNNVSLHPRPHCHFRRRRRPFPAIGLLPHGTQSGPPKAIGC